MSANKKMYFGPSWADAIEPWQDRIEVKDHYAECYRVHQSALQQMCLAKHRDVVLAAQRLHLYEREVMNTTPMLIRIDSMLRKKQGRVVCSFLGKAFATVHFALNGDIDSSFNVFGIRIAHVQLLLPKPGIIDETFKQNDR